MKKKYLPLAETFHSTDVYNYAFEHFVIQQNPQKC